MKRLNDPKLVRLAWFISDVFSTRNFYADPKQRQPGDAAPPTIPRSILAWVVGLCVPAATSGLGFGESADYFLFMLGVVLAIRVGMAIYAKRLLGGVSRAGNILFVRWALGLALLGILAGVTDHFLDGHRFMQGGAFVALFWGVGALMLFKWRLIPFDHEY